MATKSLYAGSFDPLTMGHMDIILRASKLFDCLTVGVVANPQKKALFSIKKRKEIIEKALKEYNCNNIKIESFEGLLADYVNANKFDVVIRGLRDSSDFENEFAMAHMNAHLYRNDVDTVFLMTCPEYSFLSSSMIKEVAALKGEIKDLVPMSTYDEFKKIYDL